MNRYHFFKRIFMTVFLFSVILLSQSKLSDVKAADYLKNPVATVKTNTIIYQCYNSGQVTPLKKKETDKFAASDNRPIIVVTGINNTSSITIDEDNNELNDSESKTCTSDNSVSNMITNDNTTSDKDTTNKNVSNVSNSDANTTSDSEGMLGKTVQTDTEKQTESTTVKKVTIQKTTNKTTGKIKIYLKKIKGYKYQIVISTNKKFKKGVKKYTTSKTSYTIKNLKNGKRYYVRARVFKKVNGKKVYGKWTAIKSIRTNI